MEPFYGKDIRVFFLSSTKTVFHTRPYDRFIHFKNSLRKKKLHTTKRIKAPIFLEVVLAVETM